MSGTLRHDCAAGIDCLLKQEVENLVKVATVIQGYSTGTLFGLPSKGPIV